MGSALLRAPELALEQTEAHMLAEGAANVMRHYPSVVMPAQMVDWTNLVFVLGAVYGPRFMVMRQKRIAPTPSLNDIRAAAGNPPKEPTATVTPIRPQTQAPNGPHVMSEIPGLPGVSIMRPSQV